MTHVWLENPETGGKAQFSVESADMWQARGWQPCDSPEEPDLTLDEAQREARAAEAAQAAEGDSAEKSTEEKDVAEDSGEQGQDESTTRPKGRRRGSAAEE